MRERERGLKQGTSFNQSGSLIGDPPVELE
jgi:hypothetical protein